MTNEKQLENQENMKMPWQLQILSLIAFLSSPFGLILWLVLIIIQELTSFSAYAYAMKLKAMPIIIVMSLLSIGFWINYSGFSIFKIILIVVVLYTSIFCLSNKYLRSRVLKDIINWGNNE